MTRGARGGADGQRAPEDRRGPSWPAARADAGRIGGKGPRHRRAARAAGSARVSLPERLVRFLREVVAELRKVIWPSRQELVTYTIVVMVFVSFMVALVARLDFLFGQGVDCSCSARDHASTDPRRSKRAN